MSTEQSSRCSAERDAATKLVHNGICSWIALAKSHFSWKMRTPLPCTVHIVGVTASRRICFCWSFVVRYERNVGKPQSCTCLKQAVQIHVSIETSCLRKVLPLLLCVKTSGLQLKMILLHEWWHELLTLPNRPLRHESCFVCRLIGWQSIQYIVVSQHLADSQIQTMPSFSHLAKLSPCN